MTAIQVANEIVCLLIRVAPWHCYTNGAYNSNAIVALMMCRDMHNQGEGVQVWLCTEGAGESSSIGRQFISRPETKLGSTPLLHNSIMPQRS